MSAIDERIIGFVGLGKMGIPMVKRLITAGYKCTIHDIDPKQTEFLKTIATEVAPSVARVAEATRCVVLMLPNSAVVKEVVLGEKGLLSRLPTGSIIVDMSTSNPLVTQEIGEEVEKKGSSLLDAPVSGGVVKAENGTLTIMCGGKEELFAQIRPMLQEMGEAIIHTGPLGSGHTVKALNNLLSATHFLATVEILGVGKKLNIKPEILLSVVNKSTGRNLSSEYKLPNFVLTRKFNSGFSMDLMCKDIAIAVDVINETQSPAFLPGVVSQVWNLANQKGERKYDHTEIARLYEEWTGCSFS